MYPYTWSIIRSSHWHTDQSTQEMWLESCLYNMQIKSIKENNVKHIRCNHKILTSVALDAMNIYYLCTLQHLNKFQLHYPTIISNTTYTSEWNLRTQINSSKQLAICLTVWKKKFDKYTQCNDKFLWQHKEIF